jgi:flagellar hook-associated protein 3 FlgL
MRITNDSNYRNLLDDIQRIAERMQSAQSQITSGKKLNRPSDNPSGASDVLRIDTERATNAQYVDNAATAQSRLQIADSTLDGVQQVIDRIHSLGLLADSGTNFSTSSTEEIDSLRDQLLSYANTAYDGQFIFAGSNTDSPAYVKASNGTITYAGDSQVMKLQIGNVTTLQTQIPGDQSFTAGVDIFQAVADLSSAVASGDRSAIRTGVANLEQFLQIVSSARTRLGGLINQASATQNELKQSDLAQVAHLSQLQDADLAQAITEFGQSQTALQAATAVGARVSSISILDYLK